MPRKLDSILIVEDDPKILYTIRPVLKELNFFVDSAVSVQSAIKKIQSHPYKVVILDRMLPDGDAITLLPIVRECSIDTRIIILSEKGATEQKIKGLAKGADDYLPKPFCMEELVERVKVLCRRSVLVPENKFHMKGFCLDFQTNTLSYKEKNIKLTPKEFNLIITLFKQPNNYCTKEMIASLWPFESYPTTSTVNVLIRRLRKKLQDVPIMINTQYNAGYELSFIS